MGVRSGELVGRIKQFSFSVIMSYSSVRPTVYTSLASDGSLKLYVVPFFLSFPGAQRVRVVCVYICVRV